MSADCYRTKIRLLVERTSAQDHDFEVESLRIISPEPQRAKDYTVAFEQEKDR